jgi:hypothetical protein
LGELKFDIQRTDLYFFLTQLNGLLHFLSEILPLLPQSPTAPEATSTMSAHATTATTTTTTTTIAPRIHEEKPRKKTTRLALVFTLQSLTLSVFMQELVFLFERIQVQMTSATTALATHGGAQQSEKLQASLEEATESVMKLECFVGNFKQTSASKKWPDFLITSGIEPSLSPTTPKSEAERKFLLFNMERRNDCEMDIVFRLSSTTYIHNHALILTIANYFTDLATAMTDEIAVLQDTLAEIQEQQAKQQRRLRKLAKEKERVAKLETAGGGGGSEMMIGVSEKSEKSEKSTKSTTTRGAPETTAMVAQTAKPLKLKYVPVEFVCLISSS